MAKMAGMYAEQEQDADRTTVGGRINYFRRSLGLSQEDLANALPEGRKGGKSRATIALYESGKPVSLETIVDLASILGLDPSYLAFGVLPDAGTRAPQGQRVPINCAEWGAEDEQHAFFPRLLTSEFGAEKKSLELVRLTIDAPTFGIRAPDYLLIDIGCTEIKSDGRLYALATAAGITLVRSEPTFARVSDNSINFISGQGANYSLPSDTVEVVGQVVAALNRVL